MSAAAKSTPAQPALAVANEKKVVANPYELPDPPDTDDPAAREAWRELVQKIASDAEEEQYRPTYQELRARYDAEEQDAPKPQVTATAAKSDHLDTKKK